MADFNYYLLKEIGYVTTPSASVYVNSAATASYIRQIILYNTSASVQTVQLWKLINGVAITDANKFFNYGLSGSATFILDFGAPGLMLTQSNDAIWASTTNVNGATIQIVGGKE